VSPPGPNNTGVPKLGDDVSVAGMCRTVDRLTAMERKIDQVLASQADVIHRLVALETRQSRAKR
jgi:hypothetical protein